MSPTNWEYLSAMYTYDVRKITSDDPEFPRLPPGSQEGFLEDGVRFHYWFEQQLYVWQPAATEPEIHVIWIRRRETPRQSPRYLE
jgi:hypothetical protein